MSAVAAIVLAAGRSSRMGGSNKLLADIAGQPVLQRTVCGVLKSQARPVIVVTGHDAAAVQDLMRERPVDLVHNVDFASGMATSLMTGVAATPDNADGALICLGDMPLIGAATINALIDAFAAQSAMCIVVPVHDGRRGHPVLWGRGHFTALRRLTGDKGARPLLDEHAADVIEVEVPDRSIFADADTPDALARIRSDFAD